MGNLSKFRVSIHSSDFVQIIATLVQKGSHHIGNLNIGSSSPLLTDS